MHELARIERRLIQLSPRELSYAEQQADGIISKEVHKELMIRLSDERAELIETQTELADQARQVEQARAQLDSSQTLLNALPSVLTDLP